MTSKSDLRIKILNNRKLKTAIEINDASNHILEQLLLNEKVIHANKIGIFYPLNSEIDIRKIMDKLKEKRFAMPKVIGDEIVFLEVNHHTKYIKSNFNIYEPKEGNDLSDQLDLVIVPALAMNKRNYRLGYGKGFFDKYFKKYHNSYKIGIIYKDEELHFQVNDHDIALDCYLMG